MVLHGGPISILMMISSWRRTPKWTFALLLLFVVSRATSATPPGTPHSDLGSDEMRPAQLWRLPGLDDEQPTYPSLANFSASLTARGFQSTGTRASALAAHRPVLQ